MFPKRLTYKCVMRVKMQLLNAMRATTLVLRLRCLDLLMSKLSTLLKPYLTFTTKQKIMNIRFNTEAHYLTCNCAVQDLKVSIEAVATFDTARYISAELKIKLSSPQFCNIIHQTEEASRGAVNFTCEIIIHLQSSSLLPQHVGLQNNTCLVFRALPSSYVQKNIQPTEQVYDCY